MSLSSEERPPAPGPGLEPALEESEELAAWFSLLGDPTRVRILYALVAVHELPVGELARAVGSSESTVSHALRLLRTARVVRSRRAGRSVRYALDDEHVRGLLELGRDHLQHDGGS